jgi:TolB-like protein/class 3 adenylate cyclase/Flp pilus assembly protein TadD
LERRLAVILAADVAGYSKSMEEDEAGTLSALSFLVQDLIKPLIAKCNGRIVKLMGDGILAEFNSVVDAIKCGIEWQEKNSALKSNRLQFRIGINLGEIIVQDNDIFGNGVNTAARLEGIAPPGGICISDDVYRQAKGKINIKFEDMGEQTLKNIEEPVRVFRITAGDRKNQEKVVGSDTSTSVDTSLSNKPSIAVLPFDNMSGDPEQEFFSDGIAEDIITALSHFREFFVIARNTTFTYKGQPVKIDKVCKELGVRYLLEGSVRKAGQRIRVTAQLIEGKSETHLWAAKFDRDLDDIFAVQDEITQAIVTAVAPETLNAELKRSRSKQVGNHSVWEKTMLARWHMNQLSREGNETACQLLNEVTGTGPDIAEAYSSLASCYLQAMLHLWCSDSLAAITLAETAAKQAVVLEGNDAEAYSVLGMTSLFAEKFDDAFEYLDKAIRLNPNLANAYGILAAAHGVSGDYVKACQAVEQALALSPRDTSKTIWYAGWGIAAFNAEHYEECIEIASKALREHPGLASSLRQLTASYGMLGRKEDASTSLGKLLERMPDLTITKVRDIVPFRHSADKERWLEGLRRAGLPQ